MFCTFWLQNVLLATAACNFWTSQLQKMLRTPQFFSIFTGKRASRHSGVWFLLWTHDSAPAALTSLLFDSPDTRIIGKTQHFVTSLTFGAGGSCFFWLSRYCIFFLLTLLHLSAFHLLFNSPYDKSRYPYCIFFVSLRVGLVGLGWWFGCSLLWPFKAQHGKNCLKISHIFLNSKYKPI